MQNALDEEIPACTGAALVIATKDRNEVDVDTWQKVTETVEEFLTDGYGFEDLVDFDVTEEGNIRVVLTDTYRRFCREKTRAEADIDPTF